MLVTLQSNGSDLRWDCPPVLLRDAGHRV